MLLKTIPVNLSQFVEKWASDGKKTAKLPIFLGIPKL